MDSSSPDSPELPLIHPQHAFLFLKPWLRDRLHDSPAQRPASMQRAVDWLAEADTYARIQGISLTDREYMYKQQSPSAPLALYILPLNRLDKIERANKRAQDRLDFALEASSHEPFSPDEQRQVQERRDARQRQIARRAGAALAMKQRYRPDCCEGCGLPTVPDSQCRNPRHLLLPLPSSLSQQEQDPLSTDKHGGWDGWGSSRGWGVTDDRWGSTSETEPVVDVPLEVESNPWWYGDQRMLLIPEDDLISPPGSPGPWKTDYDCLDDTSDDYQFSPRPRVLPVVTDIELNPAWKVVSREQYTRAGKAAASAATGGASGATTGSAATHSSKTNSAAALALEKSSNLMSPASDEGGDGVRTDGQVVNDLASNERAFVSTSDAAKELGGDASASSSRSGNTRRGLAGGGSTAEELGGVRRMWQRFAVGDFHPPTCLHVSLVMVSVVKETMPGPESQDLVPAYDFAAKEGLAMGLGFYQFTGFGLESDATQELETHRLVYAPGDAPFRTTWKGTAT
ncbi:hypothetical protein C8F01DRAFT_1080160 [Mycena amicta]|nr:hypothetical protein C8F01DRAFT_1080160 [Mycena amicta]